MTQPASDIEVVPLAKNSPFDSLTVVPTFESGTDTAMSATAAPYRLYKRRWIGVFAMVSTAFVFPLNLARC
jgi:hypothetical protein